MIVDALDLFDSDAHIVTDTLHFFGSFPLYEGLAQRGAGVTWLRPRDGRIVLEDMERAITPRTKLVALSLVSTYNGFQHDLDRVCRLAHAQGALVYADIVHAAGCIPVDVRASGVDFAACSSYKWLMADFGLGFVYARRESQRATAAQALRLLRRRQLPDPRLSVRSARRAGRRVRDAGRCRRPVHDRHLFARDRGPSRPLACNICSGSASTGSTRTHGP